MFNFLSAVSPGFSLALDPRGRLGGLGRKVGSACEECEDNEGGMRLTTRQDRDCHLELL